MHQIGRMIDFGHLPSLVQPIEIVKHPPKIQVWGMISYQAVSDLHKIDPGQTVTAEYYVTKF